MALNIYLFNASNSNAPVRSTVLYELSVTFSCRKPCRNTFRDPTCFCWLTLFYFPKKKFGRFRVSRTAQWVPVLNSKKSEIETFEVQLLCELIDLFDARVKFGILDRRGHFAIHFFRAKQMQADHRRVQIGRCINNARFDKCIALHIWFGNGCKCFFWQRFNKLVVYLLQLLVFEKYYQYNNSMKFVIEAPHTTNGIPKKTPQYAANLCNRKSLRLNIWLNLPCFNQSKYSLFYIEFDLPWPRQG